MGPSTGVTPAGYPQTEALVRAAGALGAGAR
jgi:hypothetical protein